MATRKPLFMGAEPYSEEMAATDDIALGGLAMSGAITMGANKITGVGAATSANDALAYGQASWSLAAGSLTGALAMGANKITGLGVGTVSSDAVNKSQLDQVSSASKTWKELLLAKEQALVGAAGGVCQAMPIYIGTNPAANDTFVLKNTGLTETFTFKAAEAVPFDVAIGATALATLENLIQAINDDSTEWSAIRTTGLDKYFATSPTTQAVIYRTLATEDDDRMYSTVMVTGVIQVIEFATGDQNYESGSGTESVLPTADPAAKRFGFSRVFADLLQNESHITAEDNATWSWDSDDQVWQQTDASAIVAGDGMTKTAHTLNVVGGDGIVANADDIAVDLTASTSGLEIAAAKLQVKPYLAGGIETDANGVGINLEASNPSLAVVSTELGLKMLSTGGLEKAAGGVNIKIDDTPDTLDVDADGLKVVGLPSLFKINDVAVAASVTAANLLDLTDGGETTLHSHATGTATEAPKVENTLTSATDAIAAGDSVYYNANNTVGLARADTDAKAHVVGVNRSAGGAAPQSLEVVSVGPCAGVLTGATFNTAYYLDDDGGLDVYANIAAGSRVIRMGYAINATDLFVDIADLGKRAA